MALDEIDPERRALFGFQWGFRSYRGWFDVLFEEYSLYPYLNITRQETHDLLYKKNLLLRLIPVFSKELRITTLLNKIIGMDLLTDKSGTTGVVEQVATILVDEVESRRTIEKRIADVEARLIKNGRYFSGLTHHIYGRPSDVVVKDRTPAAEGSLIAVEGVLNHVDAVKESNPALARAFDGSGIAWFLADFPYFDMSAANPNYDGNVVGVRVDDAMISILTSMPFDQSVGWYPYVTLFGVFHNSLSPKYPQIKVVDWCWTKLRLPKSYDELPKLLQDMMAESADPARSSIAHRPWIDFTRARDIPMFLSAIQIVNRVANINYDLVRSDTKALATQALASAPGKMPSKIAAYFSE
ncbi:MAG TPA: hypothetical protein VEK57_05830 [Thermoanaerobaculia bacterium]|nr:hypothetical protein [Thermoanaerobaculia bacterium]